MKITTLWVYPIKALRGIRLAEAYLGPQGIRHDRRFMICRVGNDGVLQKVQLSSYPQCSLFEQEFVYGNGETEEATAVRVRYATPNEPLVEPMPEHGTAIDVPLNPDISSLEKAHLNLHNSLVTPYRMGSKYDVWFSACFGFEAVLLYIGDERRPVLGTFSPRVQLQSNSSSQQKGWLSSLASYVAGSDGGDTEQEDLDWLAFSDCAPFLVATEASLSNVSARLTDGRPMDMYKFRPNIVVDGEEAWDEDFWEDLALLGSDDGDDSPIPILAFSKMCNRCASVNVDYDTGRAAEGERGNVLKKLMSDRRVDAGWRYAPVFGHYAFLADGLASSGIELAVGDEVGVTRRSADRPVWDWPMKSSSSARYYRRNMKVEATA